MLPITAVERETGISKELLRMWERRYGFPCPERDQYGDRIYHHDQIVKLRTIRRLLDAGFRPGKIINLALSELEQLVVHSQRSPDQAIPHDPQLIDSLAVLLKNYQPLALEQWLVQHLMTLGLRQFSQRLIPHLAQEMEDALIRGKLERYECNLFVSHVARLLRQQMLLLPTSAQSPRILLSAPPDSTQPLPLLRLECLLRLDGMDARHFGHEMSVRELHHAAMRHEIDVLLLHFGPAYSATRVSDFIDELRFRLPQQVSLWGFGLQGQRALRRHAEHCDWFHDPAQLSDLIERWHHRITATTDRKAPQHKPAAR